MQFKVDIHLTGKNCLSLIGALVVLALALITLLVPPWHLSSTLWRSIVIGLAIVGVIAFIWLTIRQSREDHERDQREKSRDEKFESIVAKIAELHPTSSKSAPPEPTTRNVELPQSAETKKVHPVIDGHIYRIVSASKSSVGEITRDLYRAMNRLGNFVVDADVLAEMYIVNASDEKLFLRDVVGTVEIDGKTLPLIRQNDFRAWEFDNRDYEYCLDFSKKRFDRTKLEPLKALLPSLALELEAHKPLEGWLHFAVKQINDPEKLAGKALYSFAFVDSLGNQYPVTKSAPHSERPEVTTRAMPRVAHQTP